MADIREEIRKWTGLRRIPKTNGILKNPGLIKKGSFGFLKLP
jgi:hypothetical protein